MVTDNIIYKYFFGGLFMGTKITEGMVISLAPSTGAWITQDRGLILNQDTVSIKLTKKILKKYGENIVKALNYKLLVIGEYKSIQDIRGINSETNNREKLNMEIKNNNNKESDTPSINNVAIDDCKEIIKLPFKKFKVRLLELSKEPNYIWYLEQLLILETDSNGKNRKSIIFFLKGELNSKINKSDGIGWYGNI